MVDSINAVGSVNSTCGYSNLKKVDKIAAPTFVGDAKVDTVEIKSTEDSPKISKTRLFFGRLTDEQIVQVNKTGKLPEGAKFVPNGFGGYTVCNNFFGMRAGTQVLPAGFEVKKNVLGFTCVLPVGTKGMMVKD